MTSLIPLAMAQFKVVRPAGLAALSGGFMVRRFGYSSLGLRHSNGKAVSSLRPSGGD